MTPSATLGSLVLCMLLGACASPQQERPRATTPTSTSRCAFVRMELDEKDADERSESVSLVLMYTPPNATGETAPLSTRVRVQRNRVNDLQAQLRARPELVCEPEPGTAGGFRALLP